MKPLGPDEGMNALRHPDCRFCDEYERLLKGPTALLAQCYRETGSDPDGDSDAHLARHAVQAVKELREEADRDGERADKAEAKLKETREVIDNHRLSKHEAGVELDPEDTTLYAAVFAEQKGGGS